MDRRFAIFILFTTLFFATIAIPLLAQGSLPPTGEKPWDLYYTDQVGEFVYYDMPAGASTTGKPLDIGDFDGDGCGDIAITGQNSSHPVGGLWRGSSGHVRIVMNVCNIEGHIAVEEKEPEENFITIFGAYSGDMAGTETYVADFNSDGYDDLLLSAQNSDGPKQDRSNAGAVYILFGGPDFATHTDIDLRQLGDDMMVIYGADIEDRLGLWVEGGDFDNDGFHDLLLGANQADGEDNKRSNSGEVWIIYGSEDMIATYGQVIDLTEPPEDATRILGADMDDLAGSCVWGDDLNGDGFADAIVGAGLWRASSGVGGLSFGGADGPGNKRYNGGEVFVIYGSAEMRGQTIDLATKVDETGQPVDDSVTVVYGANGNDLLGEELAVGDVDGDGLNDLIIGTLIGDGPERNLDEAGEAWVIYTHEPFAGQMFDLAEFDPKRAAVLYPDQADSKAGDTLRVADLDNDGLADIFYGAPDYDPVGYQGYKRHNAGMMAVVFGVEGGLPNVNGRIYVFDPPPGLRISYIVGANDNDMMPYALAIYDVDGDGVIDIAPNAMGGDGVNNDQTNAGEIYVISGAEFSSSEHVYVPGQEPTVSDIVLSQPPPSPRPTGTPLPQATVAASQEGNLERGKLYYEQTCAGCHGFAGEGVEGLGLSLVDSPLVGYASNLELLIFLRVGRPADHPDNQLGVSMPPSGGRPDWGNQEFADIITYLHYLRDQAADSAGAE